MARRNQRSPEAQAWRHLYKTARWKRIRLAQRRAQPLCERCLQRGRIEPMTVCHHVSPEDKASIETFYRGPFESLCKPCHDGEAQQQEKIGYSTAIGKDGWPMDERHPANRRGWVESPEA